MMKAKKLIAAVKAHKGPIMVAALAANDVFYVKVVKADLLAAIAKIGDYELEFAVTADGTGYIDRGDGNNYGEHDDDN
jgi:hypothetical protein